MHMYMSNLMNECTSLLNLRFGDLNAGPISVLFVRDICLKEPMLLHVLNIVHALFTHISFPTFAISAVKRLGIHRK